MHSEQLNKKENLLKHQENGRGHKGGQMGENARHSQQLQTIILGQQRMPSVAHSEPLETAHGLVCTCRILRKATKVLIGRYLVGSPVRMRGVSLPKPHKATCHHHHPQGFEFNAQHTSQNRKDGFDFMFQTKGNPSTRMPGQTWLLTIGARLSCGTAPENRSSRNRDWINLNHSWTILVWATENRNIAKCAVTVSPPRRVPLHRGLVAGTPPNLNLVSLPPVNGRNPRRDDFIQVSLRLALETQSLITCSLVPTIASEVPSAVPSTMPSTMHHWTASSSRSFPPTTVNPSVLPSVCSISLLAHSTFTTMMLCNTTLRHNSQTGTLTASTVFCQPARVKFVDLRSRFCTSLSKPVRVSFLVFLFSYYHPSVIYSPFFRHHGPSSPDPEAHQEDISSWSV